LEPILVREKVQKPGTKCTDFYTLTHTYWMQQVMRMVRVEGVEAVNYRNPCFVDQKSEILALLNSLKEPKGNIPNQKSRRMIRRMMEKLRRGHMPENQDMYVTTTVRVDHHHHHIKQTQMHPALKNSKKE
jgi:hypothetical protein